MKKFAVVFFASLVYLFSAQAMAGAALNDFGPNEAKPTVIVQVIHRPLENHLMHGQKLI